MMFFINPHKKNRFLKNEIYKNWGKPIMMSKNEKYFLNSSHAALSSFQSSGRITADMRFAPRLGAHPNCSLRSQLLISANVLFNSSRLKNIERLIKKQKYYYCMNFKPTKTKIIGAVIISFIITLFNFSRMIFGDLAPINYLNVVLVWPISAILIYLIWSLFEKK